MHFSHFIKLSILGPLLSLLPVVPLIWYVAQFGVNVPLWDQWELVSLFEKIATGSIPFSDFYAQHNEHRLFFPKFIFVALAFLSGWHVKVEMFFSILLALFLFVILYKIAAHHRSGEQPLPGLTDRTEQMVFHSATLLSSGLVFSLVQSDSWLSGFQLSWFLINLCLVIAIWIHIRNRVANHVKVSLMAAIFCSIASFSSVHGLFSWVAVLPLIFFTAPTRLRMRFALLWLFLGILAFFLYFKGYQSPQAQLDFMFLLKNPIAFGKFFFTLLGSPLHYRPNPAFLIGLLLFFNGGFFMIYWVVTPIEEFRKTALPWLSLSLFVFLFVCATTLSRGELGIEQAMTSRYRTVTVLWLVSLVHLWRLFLGSVPAPPAFTQGRLVLGYGLFILLITIALVTNSAHALEMSYHHHIRALIGKHCLEVVHYIEVSKNNYHCLQEVYLSNEVLKKRVVILEKIGMRSFPHMIPFVVDPQDFGTIEKNQGGAKQGTIVGTLKIGQLTDLSKIILISYNDRQQFFVSAFPKVKAADFKKLIEGDPHSLPLQARWGAVFAQPGSPIKENVLNVWVYDPYQQTFFRITRIVQ